MQFTESSMSCPKVNARMACVYTQSLLSSIDSGGVFPCCSFPGGKVAFTSGHVIAINHPVGLKPHHRTRNGSAVTKALIRCGRNLDNHANPVKTKLSSFTFPRAAWRRRRPDAKNQRALKTATSHTIHRHTDENPLFSGVPSEKIMP